MRTRWEPRDSKPNSCSSFDWLGNPSRCHGFPGSQVAAQNTQFLRTCRWPWLLFFITTRRCNLLVERSEFTGRWQRYIIHALICFPCETRNSLVHRHPADTSFHPYPKPLFEVLSFGASFQLPFSLSSHQIVLQWSIPQKWHPHQQIIVSARIVTRVYGVRLSWKKLSESVGCMGKDCDHQRPPLM